MTAAPAPEAILTELRCEVVAGIPPTDYQLVPGATNEYRPVEPIRGLYPAVALVAEALNNNSEALKGKRANRSLVYFPHPLKTAA